MQRWIISPENITTFKNEMTTYTLFYKKYKPKNSLWLQQNFTLELDDATQFWIEENVNKPCKKHGNKKLAFVVAKDILAYIENIIDTFEKTTSCIVPKHFASEKEARKWIQSFTEKSTSIKEPKIIYEGTDEGGNAIIKIEKTNPDVSNLFKSLKDKLNKASNSSIVLKNKEIIQLRTITHIVSSGHYLEFYVINQLKPIIERTTLKNILAQLPENQFLQIHKSYIVNGNFIKKATSEKITLKNNIVLPLSRTYKNHFKQSFNN